MAKDKTSKKVSIPQKHVHSRLSYLYQAATLLSTAGAEQDDTRATTAEDESGPAATLSKKPSSGQVQYLINQVRGVSRRSLVRLTPEMKRTFCKRCDMLLIAGESSNVSVQNASRNGLKPWADVLVIACKQCGTQKRFPVGREARQSLTGHESSDQTKHLIAMGK